MNLTLKDLHFLIQSSSGDKRIRSLTAQEAETYFDVLDNWESSPDSKLDFIAEFSQDQNPDVTLNENEDEVWDIQWTEIQTSDEGEFPNPDAFTDIREWWF